MNKDSNTDQGKKGIKWKVFPKLKPTQVLVLGFFLVIVLGAILLNLPMASQNGDSIGFVNALFTATSAVCVTGLVVVNTLQHWTLFGKLVILFLIQIGGLGFMTLATALFIVLGRKITLKERLLIQESLNQYSLEGMVRLARNVILGTFIIEGIGAFLLSLRFIPQYGFRRGLFMGVFHSISAFCNAGFDIIGDSSLTPYVGDILINFVIMSLVVLGGLGFTVWTDVWRVTKDKIEHEYSWRKWFQKLTLHTKMVLKITAQLIAFAFVFFLVSEFFNPHTLGSLSPKGKVLASLFQAVTPRTAGFNTIALDQMNDASKFMTIILMFIGGSPAGTAGGIKTVTAGVLLYSVLSIVRGKEKTEIYHKTIPQTTVQRSLAIIMISLGVVISVTMVLSISENIIAPAATFIEVFFEAVSAFGTVGLTIGLTGRLTTLGKIIMCITMFIGRLGPVTIATALSMRQIKNKGSISYPEERVMVG